MKLYVWVLLLVGTSALAQTRPSYYEDGFRVNVQDQSYASDIYDWCDMRLSLLSEIQMTARNLAYRQDYKGASRFILAKLRELRTREFTPYQPLSQNVVKRGVIIGENLLTLSGNEISAVKATTYFLDKYIDYIKQVITQVDRPYFRGAHCGHCGYPDQRSFEFDLIETARTNLELVNDTLFHVGARVTLGPSKLYLKAVEMLTYYSALDLSSSLFANVYTCQTQTLLYIHRELLTNHDYSQYRANNIFNKVEIAIEKLLKKRSCF